MTDSGFKALKKILPFSIEDDKILNAAFVHCSYLNENEGRAIESNERLEFLGDALLSSVLSHIIYTRFPECDEGELTRIRSRLVNGKVLAGISKELNLGALLKLGKGERQGGGAGNESILADTFEALLAALYLERRKATGDGYSEIYEFIESLFAPLIEDAAACMTHFDYKPALQELSQALFKAEPVYHVIAEGGPPHKKTFTIEVAINDAVMGNGSGGRKKDAEQLAAKAALERLKKENA